MPLGFDINGSSPTNKDLIVTYNNESYDSFIIYKDNEIYKEGSLEDTNTFNLTENGIYKIEVYKLNSEEKFITEEYIIDKEPPVINAKDINVLEGEKFDVYNIKVSDNIDTNLNITTNINELNKEVGNQKLIYTVVDSAGNISEKVVNLNISVNNTLELTLIRSGMLLGLVIILLLILRYNKTVKIEKRLEKYSISSLKENNIALYDEIKKKYLNLIKKISNICKKSYYLTKYSSKYEKYVMVLNQDFKEEMDFISSKFIVSILILLLALITQALKFKVFNIYESLIPLLFGFFIPDIVYIIKYKIHRKKVENDLLQAIIIMNNAFKSGRSILQAIELVTHNLSGAIGKEFSKMHMELTLGLDVEEVFKRFSNRINIEEVTYLTASLSILNKSGGNIIKVFSSIEKSLFNKKKLRLELNSLTGGSKIITIVLILVPILFVLLISIINKDYFKPLLSGPGLVITGIIVLFYIIYIICVKKIMKVRM